MTHQHSITIRWFVCAALAMAATACSDGSVATTAVPVPGPTLSVTKYWEVGSSVAWNKTGRELVVAHLAGPLEQSRVLAYLAVAQYNAVVAAEDAKEGGTHASPAAAAAGASLVVLANFYPADAGALNDVLAEQRSAEPWSGEQRKSFAAGEAVGRAVGALVVAYAATDRVNQMAAPANPGGPGNWTGVNPIRGLIGARTFALTSDDQFRPAPPPAITSPEFLAALKEVRDISDADDPAQRAIAVLWSVRGPAYMNEVAARMIVDHQRSERDAARILAVANMANFDVMDACYDAKLAYYLIRPVQIDPLIKLRVGMPNHPSYPSGHSCTTSAFATVLADAFPTERDRLKAMVEEAGLARMYGGLHYRFDCLVGQQLGRDVAEWVMKTAAPNGHDAIALD
jgi:hypothetical protein